MSATDIEEKHSGEEVTGQEDNYSSELESSYDDHPQGEIREPLLIKSHIIWLSNLTDDEGDFAIEFLDDDESEALAQTDGALGVTDDDLSDIVGYDLASKYL